MNIPPQEDPLLHYIASRLMRHGHRARASQIVSRILLHIHAYTRAPPLPILRQAIFAAAPAVRCLNHRRATKQVLKPIALSEKQGIWYAVEWILKECEDQKGPMRTEEKFAREIIKIIRRDSKVLENKERMHKEAMLNRGNVPVRQK
ncbi:ribosomal protein S7 [Dendrothele bispora CBS 962.96]|uniref:Ribosomal protein S7 n=1 Tax=Dendrothele bispora (strain CBS 962.96) TaxID=1314807 RepID=A0A4S8MUI8_DENBC|nr:ribosomal protein S7 [Dendrothele bispora CBS 962.96]